MSEVHMAIVRWKLNEEYGYQNRTLKSIEKYMKF